MFTKFKTAFLVIALLAILPLNLKAAEAAVTDEAELTTAIATTTVDTINIEDDFTVTAPHTISRQITIKSNPPDGSPITEYTLSGGNTSSFFNITSPSAKVDTLTLKEGKATVSGQNARGGAIEINVNTAPPTPTAISTVTISNVTFEDNKADISTTGNVSAFGGAIYTKSKQSVQISSSTFKNNSATATSTDGGTAVGMGGAIFHEGTGALAIDLSTFTDNKATRGGAIFDAGKGLKLTSTTFNKNTATADGGALVALDDFEGSSLTFDKNTAGTDGGAIMSNATAAKISQSSFTNNKAANGGAIYNGGGFALANTNFDSNEATADGGAIYNTGAVTATNAVNFLSNKAVNGGAIYNTGRISAVSMNFTGNSATGNGGALYTTNSASNGNVLISGGGSFTGNSATGLGGAVYQDGTTLSIVSQAGMTFSGNTDSSGANAIHMANSSILNLNATNSPINFYDPITGDSTNEININGTNAQNLHIPTGIAAGTGAVNFHTSMTGFNGAINAYGGTIGIFGNVAFSPSAFTAQNTTFNMMAGALNALTINSNYTQTGSGWLRLDIDLRNEVADTIEATGTVSGGNLDVSGVRFLTDSTGAATLPILISNSFNIAFDTSKVYYGPIFEYTLTQPDTHHVVANKTNNFTPTVLGASIAQNAAMLSNITISNSILNRVGVMLSKDGRYYNTKNSYSLSKYDKFLNKNPFGTSEITQKEYYATWFVPYGAFQKYDFEDNMTGVENNSYGANAGIDLPVLSVTDNVGFIPTVFAGYGGSTQKYNGLESKKDTISGGVMGTFYAPWFYASAEAHVTNGTQVAEFQQYRDTFNVFTVTSALKAELAIPLFWHITLQPNIAAAYNFVDTQNYTTGLGAPIKQGAYSNVQVLPGVKLSANIKSWHPYAAWTYAHNAYNDADIKIENFTMPEFTPKDYSEYSFGLENTFLETYSGYVQYTGYSGGISGFALQMGLRGYLDFF
jgi:predicted outer membrane repeat protein